MTSYPMWFPCQSSLSPKYDIMISYRRDKTIEFAQILHGGILKEFIGDDCRSAHVFFDNSSIVYGDHITKTLVSAIYTSTICVPLISVGTIEGMILKTQNGELDNVLMEWILMV